MLEGVQKADLLHEIMERKSGGKKKDHIQHPRPHQEQAEGKKGKQ